jgi:signal transduction histidine kinase
MTSLPSSVAQAITEATLQALDNAKKHSRAKHVSLSLGVSDVDQILISIQDDGVGFRKERIGRDRIGIKTSIIARLNAVGAWAEIDSNPGMGTTVTIRWSN